MSRRRTSGWQPAWAQYRVRINVKIPTTILPRVPDISPCGMLRAARGESIPTSMWICVPPHYDSMIAKLIVTGARRDVAIARMRRALGVHDQGIKTTIPFQQVIIDHPDFIEGRYDIGWVERYLKERGHSLCGMTS